MFKGKVLLFSLLLVFATSLNAGEVDGCQSDCYLSCDPCTMRVNICPAGDFENISAGYYHVDGTDTHYIKVIVRDGGGTGIAGIPISDYWIDACVDTMALCLCANIVNADSFTNSNGETTLSDEIYAGGCVWDGGIYIAAQGQILRGGGGCDIICLDVQTPTPDLNRTCEVTVADLTFFGQSYHHDYPEPEFDTCCDYNDDNRCSVSDFSFFGEHYRHGCM